MQDRVEEPDFSIRYHIRYHLIDVRIWTGTPYRPAGMWVIIVIALLTRLGDQRETVRQILERIAPGPAENRGSGDGSA